MTALPLPVLQISATLIGLLLAAWTLLFLSRIVLTWYPQLDRNNPLVAIVQIPTARHDVVLEIDTYTM